MVIVVDLKEIIECASKEKETLTERVAIIEQERDDLVVVVVDLKETIEEFKMVNRPGNSKKERKLQVRHTLSLKMS